MCVCEKHAEKIDHANVLCGMCIRVYFINEETNIQAFKRLFSTSFLKKNLRILFFVSLLTMHPILYYNVYLSLEFDFWLKCLSVNIIDLKHENGMSGCNNSTINNNKAYANVI